MSRQRSLERHCDKAILQTLCYAGVFKYPLSVFQINNKLISDRTFSPDFLNKSLKRLVKSGKIDTDRGIYFLAKTKPVSRESRIKGTLKLLEENKTAISILARIPWVKFIGATGSASAFNCDKSSDLDIFLITRKDRVWITRAFVVSLLSIINKYPRFDGEPGKICANLYLDESKLHWPKDKQNLYTAHEVVAVYPLYDTGNTYLQFINENVWANKYFRSFFSTINPRKTRNKTDKSAASLIETILRGLQKIHMRKKITVEIAEEHFIHFNKHDKKDYILEEYRKIAEKMGIDKLAL